MRILSEDVKKFEDELPSYEDFSAWIETYNSFHEDRHVCIPFNKSLQEVYDTEPEWVKSTYREIRYEHYYSAADKEEDTETAYWGCAGMFDRHLLTYFHDLAESWCYNGPLISTEFLDTEQSVLRRFYPRVLLHKLAEPS